MFQTFQNAVEIRGRIVPDGPILVRSSVGSLDPGVAEMEFQRTLHRGRPTVFLAGSGLKGALRAHSEALLRGSGVFACDPNRREGRPANPKDGVACFWRGSGRRAKDDAMKTSTGRHPFAGQCSACFTFGSVHLAGRFRVHDALPPDDAWDEANRLEARTQVGLDRRLQAPTSAALFDLETVVGGAFDLRVDGENFALWQLGLLWQALADLGSGLVRIGGMKSRGMGVVKLEGLRMSLRTLGQKNGEVRGAQSPHEGAYPYRLPDEEAVDLSGLAGDVRERDQGLFRVVELDEEASGSLGGRLVDRQLRTFVRELGRLA